MGLTRSLEERFRLSFPTPEPSPDPERGYMCFMQ